MHLALPIVVVTVVILSLLPCDGAKLQMRSGAVKVVIVKGKGKANGNQAVRQGRRRHTIKCCDKSSCTSNKRFKKTTRISGNKTSFPNKERIGSSRMLSGSTSSVGKFNKASTEMSSEDANDETEQITASTESGLSGVDDPAEVAATGSEQQTIQDESAPTTSAGAATQGNFANASASSGMTTQIAETSSSPNITSIANNTAASNATATNSSYNAINSNTTVNTSSSNFTATSNITTTANSTSTSTTTISTTTVPTTTRPPTEEELINGSCDKTFVKEPSFFANDGSLKDRDRFGFWVQSCGTQFVFGKILMTWRENFLRCVQMGMEPISLESTTKRECMRNLATNWKYASNYWTSGLRMLPQQTFSWCSSNNKTASTPIIEAEQIWAPQQPDNLNGSQNCIHINVTRENATVLLSDRKCTDYLIFACQGKPTPAPNCSAPVCPVQTCTKEMKYFINVTKDGKYEQHILMNPSDHGSWYSQNGRLYMYSYLNDTKSFLGAMKSCCELGMSLLSLQYDYKYLGIKAAFAKNVTEPGFFWTSGSDSECEAHFGYCAANRLLRKEAIWAPGQPDNKGGRENHLAVWVEKNKAQLSDFNEDSKMRYICEARDASSLTYGGKSIKDECGMAHNVSPGEMNAVMDQQSPDQNTKCFLKCIGDNGGLMVDGKFVENEVVATLETMADGNSTALKNNLLVLETCENATDGMDDCDKAARIIQCCKAMAPDVVNGLILALDKSISSQMLQSVAPLLPSPPCLKDAVCQIDRAAIVQFHEATAAYSYDADHLIQILCDKKYVFFSGSYNYADANTQCCKYGLKLAVLESPEEITCVDVPSFIHSGCNVWVGGSLPSTSLGADEWCQSTVAVKESSLNITSDPDPLKTRYVFILNQKALQPMPEEQTGHVLCE